MADERGLKLEEPAGAVWLHNFKMLESIIDQLNSKTISCPKCAYEFSFTFSITDIQKIRPQTIFVKIKSYKEKYIGLQNGRKSRFNQPDYFLHVHSLYTGAAVSHPFPVNRAWDSTTSVEATPKADAS